MKSDLNSFICSTLCEKQIDLDRYDNRDKDNLLDGFYNIVSVYGKDNFVKTVDFITNRGWHKSVDPLKWNYLFASVAECFRDIPDTDKCKLERMRNFDYFKYFKLTSGQARFLTDAVKYGFDFKPYINQFGGNQLVELAEGLKKGLDVSSYANPKLSCEEMKYIRQSLDGTRKSNNNEFVEACFVDDQSQLEKHNSSQSSNDDRVIVGNVFELDDGLYKIVFDENKLFNIPRKSFFQMCVKKKFMPEGKSLPEYRSPFYVYYNKSGVYPDDDIYVRAKITVNTNMLCDSVPSERTINYIKSVVYDNTTIFMKWTKDEQKSWRYNLFYFKDAEANKTFASPSFHKKDDDEKKQFINSTSTFDLGIADFCTQEYHRYCYELKNEGLSGSQLDKFRECYTQNNSNNVKQNLNKPSFTQQSVEKQQNKSKHKISV